MLSFNYLKAAMLLERLPTTVLLGYNADLWLSFKDLFCIVIKYSFFLYYCSANDYHTLLRDVFAESIIQQDVI